MRRSIIVLGILLLLSTAASAQNSAGKASKPDPSQWQFAAAYQYNRVNLTGSPFNTSGINLFLVRFFGSWVGLEGQLGVGFGKTGTITVPPDLTATSFFVGGGPHVAYRHGPAEPWVHAEVGMEHFGFSQSFGVLGTNTAFAWLAGGGIDFPVLPHVAIRTEVDALGTHFFSVNQRHFQVLGGLAFNF